MIDKLMLEQGVNELNLAISGAQIDTFDSLAELLIECNESVNLTSILTPSRILTEHFLDSITCLTVIEPPGKGTILDIGTGAGFPGLPIAIMFPDLECILMDSTQKKLNFIDNVCEILNISNVTTLHARAEAAAHDKNLREKFDIVYARAVGEMKILSELCLPFVAIDGHFIAQKSMDYEIELEKGKSMIGNLGGKVSRIYTKKIPFTEIKRTLIVMEKIKSTPKDFPRHYSKIKS